MKWGDSTFRVSDDGMEEPVAYDLHYSENTEAFLSEMENFQKIWICLSNRDTEVEYAGP